MTYQTIVRDKTLSLLEKHSLVVNLRNEVIQQETTRDLMERMDNYFQTDEMRSIQIKAFVTYIPYLNTEDCWRAIQLMREILFKRKWGDGNYLSYIQAGNFFTELTKMGSSIDKKEILLRITNELNSFIGETDPQHTRVSFFRYSLRFLQLYYQQSTNKDEQQLIFDCLYKQLSNRNVWIRSYALRELLFCSKHVSGSLLDEIFKLAQEDLQQKYWLIPYATLGVREIVAVTPIKILPGLIDFVRAYVAHFDSYLRGQAVRWLSKYTKFIASSHVETVLAILKKELTRENPYMKLAAINALSHLHPQLQNEERAMVIDNLFPFLKKGNSAKPYIIFAVWDCLKIYRQDMSEKQIQLYKGLLMVQMIPHVIYPFLNQYLKIPHAELIGNLQEFPCRGLFDFHLDGKYRSRNFYREGCKLLASSNFSFTENELTWIIDFLVEKKLLRELPSFGHYDFPQNRIIVLQNVIDDLLKGEECWKTNRYDLHNYDSLKILVTFHSKLSAEDKKKIVGFIYENNTKCPIKYGDYLHFADNFIEDNERPALRECVTERFRYIIAENYPIYYIHTSVLKYVDEVSDEQRRIIFSCLCQYTQEKAEKAKKYNDFFKPHYSSDTKKLEAVVDIFKKLLPKLKLAEVTEFLKFLPLHPDSRWALEIENLILSLFGLQVEWPQKSYLLQFIEQMAAKEDCIPDTKTKGSLAQCFFKPAHDQEPVHYKEVTANQAPMLQ